MRTFPGVWVPPGGHVELGETLLQAGLREMKEETGIQIEESSANILGLWEVVSFSWLPFFHSHPNTVGTNLSKSL